MRIVHLFHFYQPPWQSKEVVDRIARESYIPLLRFLKQHPRFHCAINISASLTELLVRYGYTSLLQDLAFLAKRGQAELVGSAAYHALLPLIPLRETLRQIALNTKINRKALGATYHPRGFFLPEMAYAPKLAPLLEQEGFSFVFVSPIALTGTMREVDMSVFYRIRGSKKLATLFLRHDFSDTIVTFNSVRAYREGLKKIERSADTIVIATDAELYGHHQPRGIAFLSSIANIPSYAFLTPSEFLAEKRKTKTVTLRASTWSTRPVHLKRNLPYPAWQNAQNPILTNLWKLAHVAIRAVTAHPKDKNFIWARRHLDWGLASCTWWWASAEINWSPDEIEKGVLQLIKSIRSLHAFSPAKKIKAEQLYSHIIFLVWQWHWSGKARAAQKRSILIKR